MYITLAQVYDHLMGDVDYASMVRRIEAIFHKYRIRPSLVLDLGCGTGTLSLLLAARGFDMIGVDESADMLAQAGEKARAAGVELLLLQQDIRAFELYGTVGAVLATLDVLNHVTDKRGLRSVFQHVRNYLEPGGLFLFDVNSPYKLTTLLPSQPSWQVDEEVTWIWDSRYDKRRDICTFDLTFFLSDGEGRYVREDETHEERVWREADLRGLLAESGLECLSVHDGFGTKPAGPETERLFFVVRRPV